MKAALDLPLEYDETLKDGFWLMTRVAPSLENEFTKRGDVCEENNEDDHFAG